MAKREKRPFWFKLFLSIRPMLDAIPDESAGEAMKTALAYFEDRGCEIADLDPLATALFAALKTSIDESYADFERSVESGKKGARTKKAPLTTPKGSLAPLTEEEVEVEVKEVEGEGEERREVFSNEKTNKRLVSDPELNETLLAYIDYREKVGKPVTDYAVQLMIDQLSAMSSSKQEAVEIVNQSIVRGWMGFFPLANKAPAVVTYGPSERQSVEANMDRYLNWDEGDGR